MTSSAMPFASNSRGTNGASAAPSGSLADLLERVLDKGIVIAGDVVVSILDIELLTLKIRLLIASVDTAEKMGIDWWKHDSFVSSQASRPELPSDGSHDAITQENERLRQRISELEGAAADDSR